MQRFKRTELLLGKEGLAKLSCASVAVFGLGAVGSYAVEALARSGIKKFTLVDFDRVRISNFNRQLYALESNLEKYKADIAKQKILDINPSSQVEIFREFGSIENFSYFLTPNPDVIIDAIDSVTPKADLLFTSVSMKIPVISSMGAAGKTDPFAVKAGDISVTSVCRLARMIRKKLTKKGIKNGITCIYSTEKSKWEKNCKTETEEELMERGRKRNPIGSVSYLTGIFGLLTAYKAMEVILNKKHAAV